MKIIIVGTTYPYRGGLAAYNERLAREYSKQGHEVEIYTFSLQYPSFLFPGKTQFSGEKAPVDLKIHRRINSLNPVSWIKTGREIKKKSPDKIIFSYWMAFVAPCFGTISALCPQFEYKNGGAYTQYDTPRANHTRQIVSPVFRECDGRICSDG